MIYACPATVIWCLLNQYYSDASQIQPPMHSLPWPTRRLAALPAGFSHGRAAAGGRTTTGDSGGGFRPTGARHGQHDGTAHHGSRQHHPRSTGRSANYITARHRRAAFPTGPAPTRWQGQADPGYPGRAHRPGPNPAPPHRGARDCRARQTGRRLGAPAGRPPGGGARRQLDDRQRRRTLGE